MIVMLGHLIHLLMYWNYHGRKVKNALILVDVVIFIICIQIKIVFFFLNYAYVNDVINDFDINYFEAATKRKRHVNNFLILMQIIGVLTERPDWATDATQSNLAGDIVLITIINRWHPIPESWRIENATPDHLSTLDSFALRKKKTTIAGNAVMGATCLAWVRM